MSGIDWTVVGLVVIVAAVALLVGATMGYFSASRDLGKERARAWDAGFHVGTRNASARLAPEPPHYIVPTPPRADLFDQDEEA